MGVQEPKKVTVEQLIQLALAASAMVAVASVQEAWCDPAGPLPPSPAISSPY